MSLTEAGKQLDHLQYELETVGFSVLETDPSFIGMRNLAMVVGEELGARSMGEHFLVADGTDEWLSIHTEGINQPQHSLVQYFALGALIRAREGGQTHIYDARQAAQILLGENSELANVSIGYGDASREGGQAVHPLIDRAFRTEPVVRFRERFDTDTVRDLPDGMEEEELYHLVAEKVRESELVAHDWTPGEVIVVNNGITLHSRAPHKGDRLMVRYRYDDPRYVAQTIEPRAA